jgi:hypothetical protein
MQGDPREAVAPHLAFAGMDAMDLPRFRRHLG